MGSVSALVANELIVLGGAATQPRGQLFKSLSTATLSDAGALAVDSTITAGGNISAPSHLCTDNVGVAPTGVTAVEHGDGINHCTVLTVALTDCYTVADNSALCDGALIYTFPAGRILIEAIGFSLGVTLAEDTTNTPEFGLGFLAGSDTQATLGADDVTCENIHGPETLADCAGTAEVVQAIAGNGTPLALAVGDAHTVYANIAATWADTAGTDLTGDLAGECTICWKFLG